MVDVPIRRITATGKAAVEIDGDTLRVRGEGGTVVVAVIEGHFPDGVYVYHPLSCWYFQQTPSTQGQRPP